MFSIRIRLHFYWNYCYCWIWTSDICKLGVITVSGLFNLCRPSYITVSRWRKLTKLIFQINYNYLSFRNVEPSCHPCMTLTNPFFFKTIIIINEFYRYSYLALLYVISSSRLIPLCAYTCLHVVPCAAGWGAKGRDMRAGYRETRRGHKLPSTAPDQITHFPAGRAVPKSHTRKELSVNTGVRAAEGCCVCR